MLSVLQICFYVKNDAMVEGVRSWFRSQKTLHVRHSRYQTLRFIEEKGGLGSPIKRLYLNGEHQFSSHNEHRYHESLVHPVMSAASVHAKVLVLGGGDGLVLRELWKYRGIQQVTLVDLDPAMTEFGRKNPVMQRMNRKAFLDHRLKIVHEDAFQFLKKKRNQFDVAILDLPVPATISLSKLYTRSFYRMLKKAMRPGGAAISEAAVLNPEEYRPFWCLVATQKAAGWKVSPYLDGTMAYTLMTKKTVQLSELLLRVPTRHLTTAYMRAGFSVPGDIHSRSRPPVHTLDNHALMYRVLELRR